jgi:methionyl-tRNA synthetase
LREVDNNLIALIENGFKIVGDELETVHLRSALEMAMNLAKDCNAYLSDNEPWKTIKTDPNAAALTIFTALKVIDSLKIIFAPFLPFTSAKLHEYMGYDTPLFGEQYTEDVSDSLGSHKVLRYRGIEGLQWKPSALKPGTKLNQPGPLFKKLEEKVVEEERTRLGKKAE